MGRVAFVAGSEATLVCRWAGDTLWDSTGHRPALSARSFHEGLEFFVDHPLPMSMLWITGEVEEDPFSSTRQTSTFIRKYGLTTSGLRPNPSLTEKHLIG